MCHLDVIVRSVVILWSLYRWCAKQILSPHWHLHKMFFFLGFVLRSSWPTSISSGSSNSESDISDPSSESSKSSSSANFFFRPPPCKMNYFQLVPIKSEAFWNCVDSANVRPIAIKLKTSRLLLLDNNQPTNSLWSTSWNVHDKFCMPFLFMNSTWPCFGNKINSDFMTVAFPAGPRGSCFVM